MTVYFDALKQTVPYQIFLMVFSFIAVCTVFAKTSSGISKYVQKTIDVVVRFPIDVLALIFNFILKLKNKEPLQYCHTSDNLYVGDSKFDLAQFFTKNFSYDDTMPFGGDELREKRKPVLFSSDFSPPGKGFRTTQKKRKD